MAANRAGLPWKSMEWPVYAASAIVTGFLTALALQLWTYRFNVPFTYTGDALPTGAHFKTVLEEGWYEYQPRLSAPFGQTYNDFPTADNLHLVAAKLLGLFTSDWAVALNAYFVIGFVLAAVAAAWLFRVCGISKPLTVVLAALFALAPYHFVRGESHLWLASYYAVPLGLGLLVLLLRQKPLWGAGTNPVGVLRWILSPASRTLVFTALLASSSSYYGVFFLFMLAATGIAVLIRDKAWKPFIGAAAAGVWTVVVIVVNMLPDIIYSRVNGANVLGLERSPGEAEVYALKFSQLILPWPGHRAGILQEFRRNYEQLYPSSSEQPALGLIAAAGFIAAFIVIGVVLLRRRPLMPERVDGERWTVLGGLTLLVLIAFLLSTIGGISTLISFFTSSLRGWNRMSIVIGGLSLAIVGLLLDLAWERFRARSGLLDAAALPRRAIGTALCLALLGVGFYDQTPEVRDPSSASFDADRTWIAEVEDQLPTGAQVLLLPHIPFPESASATGFLASDQLIPYLHSADLQWSTGGIKGRPRADWPGQLDDYPTKDLATLAATADFSGIMLVRQAFVDRGDALEDALRNATGIAPQHSDDDRYVFFNLEELRKSIAAVSADDGDAIGAVITDPVTPYPYPGFSNGFDTDTGESFFGGSGTDAAFTLVNDASSGREVHVSFQVTSEAPKGTVSVTLPSGKVMVVEHTTPDVTIDATFEAPPGSSHIVVDLKDAAGEPVTSSAIHNLSVTHPEVVEYLAAGSS